MAKCKVLALLTHDSTLLDHCKQIAERKDQLRQKMEFIKKQAENAVKEMKRADEPNWEAIIQRLKETGVLDGYNKQTHHLSFSIESNAMELCENEDERHPLEMIFGPFMR